MSLFFLLRQFALELDDHVTQLGRTLELQRT